MEQSPYREPRHHSQTQQPHSAQKPIPLEKSSLFKVWIRLKPFHLPETSLNSPMKRTPNSQRLQKRSPSPIRSISKTKTYLNSPSKKHKQEKERELQLKALKDFEAISINHHQQLDISEHKGKKKEFLFNQIFGNESDNKDVYQNVVDPHIKDIVDGKGFTLLTYGISGSGKTHTVFGSQKADSGQFEKGMIYHVADQLFDLTKQRAHEYSFKVTMSLMEIYNEQVHDLLYAGHYKDDINAAGSSYGFNSGPHHQQNHKNMTIIESPFSEGVLVQNLSKVPVQNLKGIKELLQRGQELRVVSPNLNNQNSSRSHVIIELYVEIGSISDPTQKKVSKLRFVDLAGSEKVYLETKEVANEGANINKSLLSLTNCINIMSENKKSGAFVPYRNSKLTRILKDSLNGSTPVLLVVCIAPNFIYLDETLNSLKYAEKASKIKEKANQVPNKNQSFYMNEFMYKKKIQELQAEVEFMRSTFQGQKQGLNNPYPALKEDTAAFNSSQFLQVNPFKDELYESNDLQKDNNRNYDIDKINLFENKRRDLSQEGFSKASCSKDQSHSMNHKSNTESRVQTEKKINFYLDSLMDKTEEINLLKQNILEIDQLINMNEQKISQNQQLINSSQDEFSKEKEIGYNNLNDIVKVLEENLDLREETMKRIDHIENQFQDIKDELVQFCLATRSNQDDETGNSQAQLSQWSQPNTPHTDLQNKNKNKNNKIIDNEIENGTPSKLQQQKETSIKYNGQPSPSSKNKSDSKDEIKRLKQQLKSKDEQINELAQALQYLSKLDQSSKLGQSKHSTQQQQQSGLQAQLGVIPEKENLNQDLKKAQQSQKSNSRNQQQTSAQQNSKQGSSSNYTNSISNNKDRSPLRSQKGYSKKYSQTKSNNISNLQNLQSSQENQDKNSFLKKNFKKKTEKNENLAQKIGQTQQNQAAAVLCVSDNNASSAQSVLYEPFQDITNISDFPSSYPLTSENVSQLGANFEHQFGPFDAEAALAREPSFVSFEVILQQMTDKLRPIPSINIENCLGAQGVMRTDELLIDDSSFDLSNRRESLDIVSISQRNSDAFLQQADLTSNFTQANNNRPDEHMFRVNQRLFPGSLDSKSLMYSDSDNPSYRESNKGTQRSKVSMVQTETNPMSMASQRNNSFEEN